MVGGVKGKQDGWQSAPKKLNDQEKPLFLCVPTSVVLNSGIDSAWLTGRAKPHQFAICEAKANFNPAASLHSLLGEAQDKDAASTAAQGDGGLKGKKKPATTGAKSGAKPPKAMVMQMSHKWIEQRVRKDFSSYVDEMLPRSGKNYSRHVFLITPIQAAEHTVAISTIMEKGLVNNPVGAQVYAKDHAKHDVQREFGEADLDAAEQTYKTKGKYQSPSKKKPKGKR